MADTNSIENDTQEESHYKQKGNNHNSVAVAGNQKKKKNVRRNLNNNSGTFNNAGAYINPSEWPGDYSLVLQASHEPQKVKKKKAARGLRKSSSGLT